MEVRGRSMASRILAVSFMLAFVTACNSRDSRTVVEKAAADTAVDVDEDDAEMLKAFAKAHATLDDFLKRLEAKDPAIKYPALKVKIEDQGKVEYFWMADPTVAVNGISGTINNDPELVGTVRIGQVLTVPKTQIYDWTYVDATTGRMVGNFTACAILTHESPKEAQEFMDTYRLRCDP